VRQGHIDRVVSNTTIPREILLEFLRFTYKRGARGNITGNFELYEGNDTWYSYRSIEGVIREINKVYDDFGVLREGVTYGDGSGKGGGSRAGASGSGGSASKGIKRPSGGGGGGGSGGGGSGSGGISTIERQANKFGLSQGLRMCLATLAVALDPSRTDAALDSSLSTLYATLKGVVAVKPPWLYERMASAAVATATADLAVAAEEAARTTKDDAQKEKDDDVPPPCKKASKKSPAASPTASPAPRKSRKKKISDSEDDDS
jgi:uncharacterized membrane protein